MIPKHIIQTDEQPRGYEKHIIALNPEYAYLFFTPSERRYFISCHFPEKVLTAYDTLVPGAFQADLFRYCALYILGGVYMDYKIIPIRPLRFIIHDEDEIVLCADYERTNSLHLVTSILNSFIATVPKRSFFLHLINECVYNILHHQSFFRSHMKQGIYDTILSITGPTMVYHVYQSMREQTPRCKHVIVNNDERSYVHFQIVSLQGDILMLKTRELEPNRIHYSDLWSRDCVFYQNKTITPHYTIYVYPHDFCDVFSFKERPRHILIQREEGWGLDLTLKIIRDHETFHVHVGTHPNPIKYIPKPKIWSIVMPIVSLEFLPLSLYSRFLDASELDMFLLICPESQKKELEQKTSHYPYIPFRILTDEEILPITVLCEPGWYKQQLIKLVSCRYINSDKYIVLDSDMYPTRPFGYDDLIHNHRLKYLFEPWHDENTSHYSTHSSWWKQSCVILDIDVNTLRQETHLMSVTPQIFVKNICSSLIDHLQDRFGTEWMKLLCMMKFTEFTLYWLYVKYYLHKDSIYTYQGFPLWVHDDETNVLLPMSHDEAIQRVQHSFSMNKSIFSVVQRYLQIPYIDVFHYSHSVEFDAIFIISSTLNPNRVKGSFTTEERFEQTLETIYSIRERVPNSFCLFVDGSKELSRHHRETLEALCNHAMFVYEEAQEYVDQLNIGRGESKLLEIGTCYLKQQSIQAKRIFKLGARYSLTDDFDMEQFPIQRYVFRQHMDSSIQQYVYTTGLYAIADLSSFQTFLKHAQHSDDMIEKVYHDVISDVVLIDTLGVKGQLSYNKHFFQI